MGNEDKRIREDEDEEEDEEEDEDGLLAPDTLDDQISSTLEAIKNKDPRVYDSTAVFYHDCANPPIAHNDKLRKGSLQPFRLGDYQRHVLLDVAANTSPPAECFAEQQNRLKGDTTLQMHQEAGRGLIGADGGSAEHAGDVDDFLVRTHAQPIEDSRRTQMSEITREDVDAAHKHPETFLSRFLSARAWIPTRKTQPQAFLSDDEDYDRRAEDLEEAYNLRFEDPERANRKVVAHSREEVAAMSARKELLGKRKRAREEARSLRRTIRTEEEDEHARLRELKMDEAMRRLAEVKEAYGSQEATFDIEDWSQFLAEDWDDQRWHDFMSEKFGEDFYTTNKGSTGASVRQRTPRKPGWDRDIDVSDIVRSQETKSKGRKFIKRAKSRVEKDEIGRLLDQRLKVDSISNTSKSRAGLFRYRQTSPTNFGLSAEDILLASDTQLNQFVGLKKLAAFRDSKSKKRDKKRLGKKARLRQWRADTFGARLGTLNGSAPKVRISAALM